MRLLRNTKKLEIVSEGWNPEAADEKTQKIKYPLYREIYESGLKDILQTVVRKKQYQNENKDRIFTNEKKNILSFIGERGSGKTTAMDEFCQILKSLKDDKIKNWWIKQILELDDFGKLVDQGFYFHILEPIDAALLEEKEDLFEIIMASMYQYFLPKIGEEGFSSTYQIVTEKFHAIFQMYDSLRGHSERFYGMTDIAGRIDIIGSSYAIQKKVAELVDLLLQNYGNGRENEYLVVALDDLDLNLSHAYEMLEQLQKYFSYHKILILLTLDYDQMEVVCEEHFIQNLYRTTELFSNTMSRHIRELTNDYLTKIFHLSQRMYMPNMMQITSKAEIILNNDSEGTISSKVFIMRKIAESMRIYYDACGIKTHFCQLENIRELVTYNDFLESLINIDYDKLVERKNVDKNSPEEKANLRILHDYDLNHNRFNEDIAQRLVSKMLTLEQKKFFDTLNERNIERRASYFVDASRSGDTIFIKTSTMGDYTYGKLLEKIYTWGREYFEDKALISCVMASLTSEMVREYINYRYNPDETRHKSKYKKRLISFLGNSFGNEWVGEMLPDINIKVNNVPRRYRLGYNYSLMGNAGQITFSLERFRELKNKDSVSNANVGNVIREWLRETHLIEILVCFDMFFLKKENMRWNDDYNYNFRLDNDLVGDEKKKDKVLVVTFSLNNRIFDIMAFVKKSFDFEEDKNRIKNNLIDGLSEFLVSYFNNMFGKLSSDKDINKIVESAVENNSYFKSEITYEIAFPFFDLDLAYNVIKRVRSERSNYPIESEELFSSIVGVYQSIEEKLKDEIYEYYNKKVDGFSDRNKTCDREELSNGDGMIDKDGLYDYLLAFQTNPYIVTLRTMNRNKKISTKLSEIFARNIRPKEEKPNGTTS